MSTFRIFVAGLGTAFTFRVARHEKLECIVHAYCRLARGVSPESVTLYFPGVRSLDPQETFTEAGLNSQYNKVSVVHTVPGRHC